MTSVNCDKLSLQGLAALFCAGIMAGTMHRAAILSIISLIALAGCATPVAKIPSASVSTLAAETRHETGDILEKFVAARQRLAVIGMPILEANATLCPRRTLYAGFVVHSDFDVPQPLQAVARERLDLTREAIVLAVSPKSDAWHAGLRAGDIIATMNGKRVRNAADFRARAKKIKSAAPVTFGALRNGRAFTFTVPFTPICNYTLVYQPSLREINASTDAQKIYVTQGIMDFAGDDELAAVIGHELAHAVMHHIPKDRVNTAAIKIAGGIVDGIIDIDLTEKMLDAYTHVWSTPFEKEADYVGLYLLARAGGNISAAAPFWRRMAAEHGMDAVNLPLGAIRTHPSSPERFAVLKATEAEIMEKARKGRPLMPEMGGSWNFGARYSWWSDTREDDDEPDDSDLNH